MHYIDLLHPQIEVSLENDAISFKALFKFGISRYEVQEVFEPDLRIKPIRVI